MGNLRKGKFSLVMNWETGLGGNYTYYNANDFLRTRIYSTIVGSLYFLWAYSNFTDFGLMTTVTRLNSDWIL
jgi:hypothetical protein